MDEIQKGVTILILIDGFLQYKVAYNYYGKKEVTILILIDGFLQLKTRYFKAKNHDKSQSLF